MPGQGLGQCLGMALGELYYSILKYINNMALNVLDRPGHGLANLLIPDRSRLKSLLAEEQPCPNHAWLKSLRPSFQRVAQALGRAL